MLNHIGHIALAPIDSGLHQCAIEQQTCRSDKGPSLNIFAIPRLLPTSMIREVVGPAPNTV
jgi:hypothetical protein